MIDNPAIPIGYKFACIGVKGVPNDIDEKLIIPICGIHVFPPGEVISDTSWIASIGSIQYDYLSSSELTIVAMQKSDNPLVSDDEQQFLYRRVHEYYYSLLLQGIPSQEGALVVMGGNVGTVKITTVQKQDRFYRFDEVDSPNITTEKALLADNIAKGLRTAFEQNESHYMRLRKGFSAWIRGAKEELPDVRLHQFTRALEALVIPKRGETTKQFIHRVMTFTGASTQNRQIIEQIYELRSTAEHMKDWTMALKEVPVPEREAIARLRCYQSEIISSTVYVKILSDPEIMTFFETDETMEDYWSLPDDIRLEKWNTQIEIPETLS